MLTLETYILPEYWASALINDDYSGMNNLDIEYLEKFISDNKSDNCRFYCIGCSEQSFFSWHNDANNLGSDCLEYTFDVSAI